MLAAEDQENRRSNYHYLAHQLAKQFRAWRDGYDENGPCGARRAFRERMSPYSTDLTPPMGEMSDEQTDYYARRISAYDAERSINMANEAAVRAKRKAGEGQ